MNTAATRDRLRLARAEGVGPVTWRRLLHRYGTPVEALRALPDIARRAGRAAPRIPDEKSAEREITALARLGGRFLFADQPDYPFVLAQFDPPPPVIAMLGRMEALAPRGVGVVGARNAGVNGRRIAENLAEELASAECTVVSGLARGIDTAAHQGALRTGLTIAVTACGLDVPYPPENAKLQAQIAETGAVVSEAPLGTAPQDRLFPRRNRIIAGLSLGVVVVEAASRSGSLITARMALEAGRELFAVPGSPLDPRNRGSNALIREGAHLVQSAADILADLPAAPGPMPDLFRHTKPVSSLSIPTVLPPMTVPDATELTKQLIEIIGPSPIDVDDLARRCHVSVAELSASLLELELAGRLETLPGNRVAIIS